MLIIYPPTVHWDYMKARPQHLMLEFAAQGDNVIYCEPGRHISKRIEKLKDRLWLNYDASLDKWPVFEGGKRVLWISYPGHVSLIGNYQEDMVVYDVLDYPDDEFSAWKPYVDKLLRSCRIVFTVSRPLYTYFKQLHPEVHLIRNGVDYQHFAHNSVPQAPVEISLTGKPIVGFYGALAPWIDWELVEELAIRNPLIKFIFIGPVINMSEEQLPHRPNLYYLGRKSYSELPRYGAYFDVCLFPFRKTRMTRYVNPVKVYEYLAMGKPVVATDLPEILEMHPHVRAAGNIEEFQRNLLTCLAGEDEGKAEKRKKFAMENTWGKRVEQIRKIISNYGTKPGEMKD